MIHLLGVLALGALAAGASYVFLRWGTGSDA